MSDSIEIIADEVTILKAVGILTDPITGRELGIQQGAGKVYLKGEVIPESEVSPLLLDALDNEDHPSHESVSKKIRRGSADPQQNVAVRLGVPFAGYDEMDEDEILGALQVLPSSTAQAVKAYEATQEEPRENIVNYSVGFGQDPNARQEGRLGSELDEDGRDESDKVVAKLTTREVPEEGNVQAGEGITGTGDPEVPHGSLKAEDGDDGDGVGNKAARRRGRRSRTTTGQKPKQAGTGDTDSKDDE